MLVLKNRFLLFDGLQIWWPDNADEVLCLLRSSPVTTVMVCSDQVADALGPYAFRRRTGHTLVVDLSLSEEELWAGLDGQSCRYKINKAKRLGCSVSVNQDQEQAFELINHFIQRRKYRRPISDAEWRRHLEHGDLFVAKHDGKLVAAHVNLVDPPHCARLVYSATADSGQEGIPQNVLIVANRYLHWSELLYYKGKGIASYDFGGLELDQRSPIYPITQFKLSFGGRIVGQNSLRLTGNSGLRLVLRQLARAKTSLNGGCNSLSSRREELQIPIQMEPRDPVP